jgi:hypothetical protein
MIRAGFIESTQHSAVTDTSNAFQLDTAVADKRFSFLMTSDVNMHVCRTSGNAEEATAAQVTDMRVPAATPFLISGFAGDWFSFVKGTGEDDGNLWVTKNDGR